MADEDPQAEEETSWWAFDAFADSDLPSISFDEPLQWPDSQVWEDFAASEPAASEPAASEPPASEPGAEPPTGGPVFGTPAGPVGGNDDIQWHDAGTDPDAGEPTMAVTPLAGLGGGAAAFGGAGGALPESIWAPTANAVDEVRGSLATLAPPVVYAEPVQAVPPAPNARRFDIRHGNAAVIALISFVSLVLLGMFMSVRARNNLPTDTSQSPPSPQIGVQGTLSTIPQTTTVTTAAPPTTIDLGALVPAEETTAATSTGSGSGPGSSATTAAPRASAPAAGSGGSTATTQPPTATTAAPEPQPDPTVAATTPPPTAPPDDTTQTTSRRTTTSLSRPTFPTIPSNTQPSFPFPSLPSFSTD